VDADADAEPVASGRRAGIYLGAEDTGTEGAGAFTYSTTKSSRDREAPIFDKEVLLLRDVI
jgi:hypothetical protein